jgi:putative MATE family efflux protein
MTRPTSRGDYTEGPIIAAILNMGLPSMFGFLSQNIYAFVDMYWVSNLPEGEAAVAAITFLGSLLWLFYSFNNLVGPGSVAVISRRYGEKDYAGAEKSIRETLVLKLLFGLVFGALGMIFVEPMLTLLGARDETLRLGVAYGQITFAGMGIGYTMYSIFTALRSIANPKMAMIMMIASNLLNMVLDPVFIFGYLGMPALGIRGAAVASLVSMVLTLLAGLALFLSHKTNVRLRLRGGRPMALAGMWQLIKIGIPSWLGGLSYSGARLVITPLIATFGTGVVAAYGVGNQITSFGVMILVGIGLGLSSLIGQTLGAGKVERARQTADRAILLGITIMVLVGGVVATFPAAIMRLFFDEPQTVAVGVTMLRIFAIGFPFLGAFLMIEEVHTGVGQNSPAMVFNLIHSWLLVIVPVLILTQYLGLREEAIWWVVSLAGAVSAGLFYVYYRRGRWLTVTV